MATTHRIVRNALSLSSAYVAQKLLSFIYFTLIARLVGVVDTGSYVFALSYSTIWSVFADFGLSSLLQREIAQKPERTKDLVRTTLLLKSVYGIGAIALGMGVLHFLNQPPQTFAMVSIAMAVMIFDSFNLTIWSAFRGHHSLQYESVSIVVGQAVVFAVGLTGLRLNAPLEILILALLCGSVSSTFIAIALCRKKLGFWPYPARGHADGKKMFKDAMPFGLANAFSRVFASIDSVMLGQMVSKAAVGFYSVPNKVVFAAQFIPAAFAAALYPAMSHQYMNDRSKMVEIFKQALLALFLLAVPMAVGLFVLTPSIIHQLYTGAYDPAIPAMRILVWGIVFGFLEFPLGSLLAATGQQRKNSITRGVVMIVNVVLNIILIPMYSFVGTSIAALISYLFLAGMGFYWTRSYWKGSKDLYLASVKILLSGLLMGIAVDWVLPYMHFTVAIVFGAVVYGVLVLLLKVTSIAQLLGLLRKFRKGEEAVV